MVDDKPNFNYPKEWKTESLDSLSKSFTKQTGFDYTAYIKPSLINSYKRDYIPFIQNKNFEGLYTNFDTDYYIPLSVAKDFPKILLDEKCFLISISGKVGNIGVFSNAKLAFLGGAIAVVKFKNRDSLRWVMYYLFSTIGQEKLLKSVKSGSHKNLILDDIRKILIPMPILSEQKAIAQALTDIDSLLTSLEKLIVKKEHIKTATMQNLLTGKKRLDGFSGEWEEKRLGEYVLITSGDSPSKFDFKDIGIPYYKVEQLNYSSKYLQEKNTPYFLEKNSKKVLVNSIIFPKRGASIFLNKIRLLGSDAFFDTNLMALTTNNKLSHEFLFYLLSHMGLADVADTTSVPQINNKHINPFLILLPIIEEQIAIATILSEMDKEIETLKRKLKKTKDIKTGMMQELLTGKTRLK